MSKKNQKITLAASRDIPSSKALERRKTHRFVGTYQHEDEWEEIGTLRELATETLPPIEEDEQDHCEPVRTRLYILITPENRSIDDAGIAQALHDTYSMVGCHHEYDCCGCRSYHVTTAERLTGDLWTVEIYSSRNY